MKKAELSYITFDTQDVLTTSTPPAPPNPWKDAKMYSDWQTLAAYNSQAGVSKFFGTKSGLFNASTDSGKFFGYNAHPDVSQTTGRNPTSYYVAIQEGITDSEFAGYQYAGIDDITAWLNANSQ